MRSVSAFSFARSSRSSWQLRAISFAAACGMMPSLPCTRASAASMSRYFWVRFSSDQTRRISAVLKMSPKMAESMSVEGMAAPLLAAWNAGTVGVERPVQRIEQRPLHLIPGLGEARLAEPGGAAEGVHRFRGVEAVPSPGIEATHHRIDEADHLGAVESAMPGRIDERLAIERRAARLANRIFVGRQVDRRGARPPVVHRLIGSRQSRSRVDAIEIGLDVSLGMQPREDVHVADDLFMVGV